MNPVSFGLAWLLGAVGLFVLLYGLSRWLGGRKPALFKVLWLLYFAKLLVPFGVWAPVTSGIPTVDSRSIEAAPDVGNPAAQTVQALEGSSGPTWIGSLWLTGTLVVWLVPVLAGRHLVRRGLAGPAAIGIFRPRIVLPARFAEDFTTHEQNAVLAHERQHLRSHDPLWLAYVHGVVGLFWWFLPVWLARREFLDLTEMACDAEVLSGSPPLDPRAYGNLLVRLSASTSVPTWRPAFAGTFASLRRRIAGLAQIQAPRGQVSPFALATLFAALVFVSLVPAESAAQALPTTSPARTLVWPLAGVESWLTTPFGQAIHPRSGLAYVHQGADLATHLGVPVVAAANGTVLEVGNEPEDRGLFIVIDHGLGLVSEYDHLNQILVQQGQSIVGGGAVGEVGSTGFSTGPHLHFELRVAGTPKDPLTFSYTTTPKLHRT